MTRRKKRSRKTPPRRRALWALLAGGMILSFALGLWWGGSGPPPPAPPAPVKKAAPLHKPKVKAKAHPQPAPAAPAAKPAPQTPPLPRVAIVIDDMGHGLAPAKSLAALKLPLTFSILPHTPQAAAVADLAQAQGLGVMLHLPMEPHGYPGLDPGPGALLCSMSSEQLLATLRGDLASVPHVQGVNNHTGSRFSQRPELLEPVLAELKRRGLFYLDSITSPDSQGLAVAQRLGLRCGKRDVFLDHQSEREAIDRQLERLLELARERGWAVAIGHPHPETIRALRDWAPRLRREARLVPVSALMQTP